MKKVLSLVLAIAMVLSCVPFAFAEDEPASEPVEIPAVWASYDAGEAFAVDLTKHTFTGDASVDYPKTGLPAKGSTVWTIGYYEHVRGYEGRLGKYNYLFRAGFGFRANEDTVNTTLNLTENAPIEPVRLANMVWTSNATITLEDPTTTYHPHTDEAPCVYGDGGYSIPNPNAYTSSLGYSFGNLIVRSNSSAGYQNAGSVHPVILFTAPTTGLIRPKLILKGDTHNVFQISKTDAAGQKTAIYPAAGAESVSIVTPNAAVTVPEKWKDGWVRFPAAYQTYDSETIWVEAGDVIELRFAVDGPQGTSKAFSLARYAMDYINPSCDAAEEYDADIRSIDLRDYGILPEGAVFSSAALTETAVNGVFEVPADFVSGTEVAVYETKENTTHTINVTLTQARYHYDAGEAWYTDGSYGTGENGAWVYPSNLTPKYPNNGTSTWTTGYYLPSTSYQNLVKYTVLGRINTAFRAYEDPDTTRTPLMVWGDPAHLAQGTEEGVGSYMGDPNVRYGAFGYTFGGVWRGSSAGWAGSTSWENQKAIIYAVPRDGLIKPYLKMTSRDENSIAYRLEKIAPDGTRTVLLPANGQTITTSWGTALPEEVASGWGILTTFRNGFTEDSGYFNVQKGDKLELRFAPLGASKPFDLNTYTIDYIQATKDAGSVYYEEDTREVDLRQAVMSCEELPLTSLDNVEFYLPAGSPLTATETKGVYTVAEDYVDGTAVSVRAQAGWNSVTVVAKLNVKRLHYDFGELFLTSQTFVGAESDYPQAGLPTIMKNDGSDIWSTGYYTYSSGYNNMTYFDKLVRYNTNSRSPQDETNTRPTRLTYTITGNNEGAIKLQEGIGYYTSDPNGNYGSMGYTFGSASASNFAGVGAVGNIANNRHHIKAAVFKVPFDGVINPIFSGAAWGDDRVIYRMDKVAKDGTRTRIYPLPNSTATRSIDSDYFAAQTAAVPAKFKNGWGVLPKSVYAYTYVTEDQAYVRVQEGETIELLIAPINAGATSFDIDILTMDYIKSFGPNDEMFIESPLQTEYEESYNMLYPEDNFIDLRQTLATEMPNGIVPAGNLEFVISGNTDVLYETALPGVFALTGALNYGGEPAIVTAGYYNPGESAANGDEPRFAVSTEVYVRAVSETHDTFDNYHIWDLSEMTYAYDHGMALPYYADATERSLYGVVDLGLTDAWKGATVTFSDPTKFEYLGNGRIRALKLHYYTTGGGVVGKQDTTVTAKSNGGSTVLNSLRDVHSMGTPVTMTVTAPDGGTRQFGLWAFNANVQTEAEDDNTYRLYTTGNPMSNAVVSVEFPTSLGTFLPGYKDVATSQLFIPIVDHRFSLTNNIVWQIYSNETIYIPLSNQSYWDSYRSNKPYHYVNGFSQTFTAPKDGTISLTDYFPTGYMTVDEWLATQQVGGNNVKYAVELYEADGTLTSTLWYQELGATAKTDTEAYALPDTLKIDETRATMAEDETKALTFDVKKGQKVRVIIRADYPKNWGSGGYLEKAKGAAPSPVWTYVQETADTLGDNIVLTPVVADDVTLTADNVLVMVYDQNGNLLTTAKGEDVNVENGTVTVPVTDANAAYAKAFFFNDLDNIQPLASDIIVRK